MTIGSIGTIGEVFGSQDGIAMETGFMDPDRKIAVIFTTRLGTPLVSVSRLMSNGRTDCLTHMGYPKRAFALSFVPFVTFVLHAYVIGCMKNGHMSPSNFLVPSANLEAYLLVKSIWT